MARIDNIRYNLQFNKVRNENMKKCKCGHSIVLFPTDEKKICTWCGNYVFYKKIDEFRYRLNEKRCKR